MLPVGITPYYMSLLDARRSAAAAAADGHPDARRVRAHRGRGRRSAGRRLRTAPCRAWCIAIPDRVLLLALDFCSTYCRYCTRSRVVGHGEIMPQREPAGAGVRLHPPARRRFATC